MIYSELSSRIGNHLFQIATGSSLARRLGCPFAAYPRHELLKEPDLCYIPEYLTQFRENLLRKVPIIEAPPADIPEYREPEYHYIPLPSQYPLLLKGYYQSPKYFDEPWVRDLFAIDDASLSYIRSKYSFLFTERITSITIRRGDYLRVANILPVCSLRYYRAAMKKIPEGGRFLLISDDIEWCKRKFRGDNYYFVDDEPPVIDLYLQTLCEHNIISNSTFAWWGAWLNNNRNKVVVYPKRWFGMFKEANTSDLFPPEWIPVDNPTDVSVKLRAFYLEFFKRLKARWKRWLAKL